MEPKLPPLPLDLDNSPARMSMHVKAGELVRLLHQWGREVYAAGQTAPEAPASASAGQVDERALRTIQELSRISMSLAADLVKGADYTFKGHDYLDRDFVMERVVQWRSEWDATAPVRDALIEQARASLTPTAPQAATTASETAIMLGGCHAPYATGGLLEFRNGEPTIVPFAGQAGGQCIGGHDYQVSNARTGEQSCTLCGKEWGGFAPPAREDDR